jgi:hypothetical protein
MTISDCTFDGCDPCSCDCDECLVAREFGMTEAEIDQLAEYTALDSLRDDAKAMGY